MDNHELFFLLTKVLGGLALFIFGMQMMTQGLREAAGNGLRKWLGWTAANRMAGIGLGSLLGLLIHSSGATVMLVGFVNAGLMSLMQSIPVMLGANIGTTVSMQAISFDLGDYAYFVIFIGFAMYLFSSWPRLKHAGFALMGFGILFLGMTIMSDTIRPHRETLTPFLADIHANTWSGFLLGILLATAITAVIQSSGATIGMCFALAQAGIFTSLEQTMPIVLGAHLGTCATALFGSIGANMEAKRVAFSHLGFNVFNVLLAILLHPFLLWLVQMSTDNLVRQTANLHTLIMVVAAGVVLPFTLSFGRLIQWIARSKKAESARSYLDTSLLDYPEKALQAGIRELRRVAILCAHSLRLAGETILFLHDRPRIQEIKMNEKAIDDVKVAMKDYLGDLAHRHLSRRQAILIQHLDRCIIDIERIGDHIDSICDMSLRRKKIPEAIVERESLDMLFELYHEAQQIFKLVIHSLDPEQKNFQESAQQILEARDAYVLRSMNTKAAFTDKVSQRLITPIGGIFFSEYIAALDRIVKHSKSIALVERQPQFWIKRKKLDRPASEESFDTLPALVDPKDYLDRLQEEDYL